MSTSYTKDTYQDFMEEYEGSMICGCDHGCNQWLKKQGARVALGYRMMKLGSKNLDKMAQMPIARVDKIWYWVQRQDSRRWNARSNKADQYLYFSRVVKFGEIRAREAVVLHNYDLKAAANTLNKGVQPKASDYQDLGQSPYLIKSFDLRGYYEFMALSTE